ncbi:MULTISPECIES: HNH endonuclease signature motif containing protein [unclassified Cupriavidus]|uniref:HNH endonuclease n=1 Tax=unclassified Cupriavidus TaxID=2640874 RepID=UPI00295F512E|nr:HNH endonuclease signature motif containing protein [Cupriavidus sp. TA19]
MSRLQMLKPRLQASTAKRVPILETKAGTAPRPRGRLWMETRQRVALAHGFRCVDCGHVWIAARDQIDHDVPLEQGGSNDDSNLRPRCDDCHKAKTAREAAARAGR